MTRASTLHENGTPVEDLTGCTLALRTENSTKGSKAVYLGPRDVYGPLPQNADHNLYFPPEFFFTTARKAVIARAIAHTFLGTMMIGEGANSGWSSLDASTGCNYYRDIAERLMSLCLQPVGALERVNCLVVIDRVARWHNPLVTHASDLLGERSRNPLAPRFRELLRKRLAGETKVPVAVAMALKGSILGLPTES